MTVGLSFDQPERHYHLFDHHHYNQDHPDDITILIMFIILIMVIMNLDHLQLAGVHVPCERGARR